MKMVYKTKGLLKIFLILLATAFFILAAREIFILNKDASQIEEIQDFVENEKIELSPKLSVLETTESALDSNLSNTPTILDKYMDLHNINNDVYGWIKIDDTPINYPVMYTPDDPQKYLRLSFDEKYSLSGQIFMDYRCTEDSDNLIIYGHNMNNETMFSSLLKYKDEQYFREHPTINFDTLYEENKYQIVSAFYDEIDLSDKNKFNYYNFIRTEDEVDFNSSIETIKDLSIYDTNTDVEYGDKLITLSTCSCHAENGRFVVIGKRIK